LFVGAALQACFVRHANPETEVGFSWAMQMGTWTHWGFTTCVYYNLKQSC